MCLRQFVRRVEGVDGESEGRLSLPASVDIVGCWPHRLSAVGVSWLSHYIAMVVPWLSLNWLSRELLVGVHAVSMPFLRVPDLPG